METTKIADIGTVSVQLLDDESGTVLTTAPLYRCADRLMYISLGLSEIQGCR